MKLGYPCINRAVGCSASSTFRLASYSEDRFLQTVEDNLNCLQKILRFNADRGFLFFRISSDTVPFASHPVCTMDWPAHFGSNLRAIGSLIKRHCMRISMHPDQFVLINALKESVLENSVRELEYHAKILDGMGLGRSAKIQIHVGGVYGNKTEAVDRFVQGFHRLPERVQRRLVVENDDRLYSLADCLKIHRQTGIPILFDSFHHTCLNNGEGLRQALELAGNTWRKADGTPMVDFSHQKKGHRKGTHADRIDLRRFRRFLEETRGLDFDVMLEIKDKETSAMKALPLWRKYGGA